MFGFDLLFFLPAIAIALVAVCLVRQERAERRVDDHVDAPAVDPSLLTVMTAVDAPLAPVGPMQSRTCLGSRLRCADEEAAVARARALADLDRLDRAAGFDAVVDLGRTDAPGVGTATGRVRVGRRRSRPLVAR